MNEGLLPTTVVPVPLRPVRSAKAQETALEPANHETTSQIAPVTTASEAAPTVLSPVLDVAVMEMAVVVPTLNERENIEPLVQQILAADPRLHVIVVDDGSADGTAQWVRDFASGTSPMASRAHIIDRGRKLGYASAIQDGMRLALKNGARWILQMDADFSHDPKYLPDLLAKMASDNCDLVIGSRYVPGGGTRNWGIDRKIMSAGANNLARALLDLPAKDCTAGFRCWKRELIEGSGVLDVQVQGYAFLFMTLYRCMRLGAKVGEVPIIFVDRQYGKSKMNRRIAVEGVRVLWKLWWQHLRRKDV